MSTYKSKETEVNQSAEALFDKLSNLNNLGDQLAQLPADQLERIGNVRFENEKFIISTPQMGEIAFAVIDKTKPSKIVYGTPSSPIPLQMVVNLAPVSDDRTKVSTAIEVEIPAMLRPLVGGKLQEAAEKFGEMIANMSR